MKILILLLVSLNAFATFTPIPTAVGNHYAIGPLLKGELVTNNGTQNGSFPACANGETISWDSSVDAGFKCVSSSGGGLTYAYTKGISNVTYAYHPNPATDITELATAFTTNGTSNPVEIVISGYMVLIVGYLGASEQDADAFCALDIRRGGVTVASTLCRLRSRTSSAGQAFMTCSVGSFIDSSVLPSTSYAYSVFLNSPSIGSANNGQCTLNSVAGGTHSITLKQAL
jgi:hypothetical protein